MGITKEELHTLFKGLNEYSSNNLSRLHPIADDLIGHIERSHDLRKLFGVILKDGKNHLWRFSIDRLCFS